MVRYYVLWAMDSNFEVTDDLLGHYSLEAVTASNSQDCTMPHEQQLLNRDGLIQISKELGFMLHEELLHHAL